jgi:hypothetical protein
MQGSPMCPTARSIFPGRRPLLEVGDKRLLKMMLASQKHQGRVDGHSVHPAPKRRPPLEVRQVLPRCEKRILHYILLVRWPTDEPRSEALHSVALTTNQLPKCGRVTSLRAFNENIVGAGGVEVLRFGETSIRASHCRVSWDDYRRVWPSEQAKAEE